ncbi:hypothetical protein CSOJ01_15613 [Colletotrichum sojae]|uniref:Uncharacterized protein n=1 Tax=Colletotrichum sojae TaxID=2175907 RepID=A0A8H6IMT5_9PEZI|nr:hypothetical protein CSOJ01_15613 [Colletotrichum sojae]
MCMCGPRSEFQRETLESFQILTAISLHRPPYFDLTIPYPRANIKQEVASNVTALFLFVVEQILMRKRNIQTLELDLWGGYTLLESLELSWRNLTQFASVEDYNLPHLRVVNYSTVIPKTWPTFINLLLVLGPMAPMLNTLKARGDYEPPHYLPPPSNRRLLPESILPRVTDLDMTFATLSGSDASCLISACGGLTRFKWSDSADHVMYDSKEALAGVLKGLRSHRRTLQTLELRMMTDRAVYPPEIFSAPPATSFVGFERLKHLKIDTWWIPDGAILADVLPHQIETFGLTNMDFNPVFEQFASSFPDLISPVPHGSMAHPMSELSKVVWYFPSLRKVTLCSFVGRSINKHGISEEEIDTLRGAFDSHGVSFAYSFGFGLYPTPDPLITEQLGY